jgi:hypothetical protein
MSVIVNGIGPTSGASALGDLTDIGAMGEPIGQADDLAEVVTAMGGASAVRTAIDAAEDGAPAVNSDALAGTGWSIASATGGAVASWASSPARLTLDCNPGAAGSCGVTHTTKLPNREEYSIAIRVQVVNGDNSNQTRIILAVRELCRVRDAARARCPRVAVEREARGRTRPRRDGAARRRRGRPACACQRVAVDRRRAVLGRVDRRAHGRRAAHRGYHFGEVVGLGDGFAHRADVREVAEGARAARRADAVDDDAHRPPASI